MAKADAIGKLAALPLSEVLVSLLERKAAGTLVLQERSGRKCALYFYAGAVVKARTPAQVPAGADSEESLACHVEWVAALPGSTVYGLYLNVDYLTELRVAPSRPLPLLWRCARSSVDVERVERVVASLDEHPLQLHSRAGIDRFALQEQEMAVVAKLKRGPRYFSELLDSYAGDPAVLCKLVYMLAISHHLDLGDSNSPVGIEGPETIELSDAMSVRPPLPLRRNRASRRIYTSSLGVARASSGVTQRGRGGEPSPPGRSPLRRARGHAAR